MKKRLTIIAACFALAGMADDKQDQAKQTEKKVFATVEVETGQKMPIQVAFVDRKAVEEKRPTSPVPAKVDPKTGNFEVPKGLVKLPDGYLLVTYPCVKLKSVTVAGVDIRTPESAAASKLGNASTFASGLSRASEFASSLLGGVKFAECGGEK